MKFYALVDILLELAIYILVAWQGHRGDQKIKNKLSKIHLKAPNLDVAARTLYHPNVGFFMFRKRGVQGGQIEQKLFGGLVFIRPLY